MIDLTVCIGIDSKTAKHLCVSWETWKKYRPEMWDVPWVVFWSDMHEGEPEGLLKWMEVKDVRFVHWPPPIDGIPTPTYESQREKMLTGFVWVPATYVQTDWWMKIDTDAIALRNGEWLMADWFKRSDESLLAGFNSFIASSWGYTRPKLQMEQLDDWADTVLGLQDRPRLNLPYKAESNKVMHPKSRKRMASWLSFYHTTWTRRCLDYLMNMPLKIPVPSQDGFHWYCAERGGDRYHLRGMKRHHGWTNVPKLGNLKVKAKAALDGEYV